MNEANKGFQTIGAKAHLSLNPDVRTGTQAQATGRKQRDDADRRPPDGQTQMKIQGQCECGRCAYEVADDAQIDVACCHCRTCRTTTGGTCVTWATVPKARFRWTGQRPKVYRSSPHGKRYFCGTCGAQLALWTRKSPGTIDLTVATFRHPSRYPPSRHIWVQRKLKWLTLADGLPTEPRETI